MSVGMLGWLGVGVNSNTGADSVAVVDYPCLVSETLAVTKNDLDSQCIGASWDVEKIYQGIEQVGGNVTVEVVPGTIGFLLRSFFDSYSFSVGSGGASEWFNAAASDANVNVHQFVAKSTQFQTGSGSDVPTLTLEVYRGPSQYTGATDSAFIYYGMAANQFELTAEAGQITRASFDFLGLGHTRVARSTPTFPTENAFLWHQASVSVDGAGDDNFESITIRGNNQLEAVSVLDNQRDPNWLKRNGFRTFEVTGNILFRDHTQYDRFINGSEMPLQLTYTTGSFKLLMKAPALRYSTMAPNIGGPGRISVPFNGRLAYHAGSGTALEVLLVNTRTIAYTQNAAS